MVTTLDLETTTHNKGNPFDKRNFVVTGHYARNDDKPVCVFFDDPRFKTVLRSVVDVATVLVGVNLKFDIHWLTNLQIVIPQKCKIWDCQLAEFILSGQTTSFASLEQLGEYYKIGEKSLGINEYWEKGISTEDIPREIVEERGNSDVALTYKVYQCQLKDPRMNPELHKLILLDGADLKVLQKIEYNGFLYDRDGSLKESEKLTIELKEVEDELYSIVGRTFNIDGDELSYVLFGGDRSEDIYESVDLIYKSGPRIGESYTRQKFIGTTVISYEQIFKPLKGSELKKEGLYSTADDVLLQLKAKTKKQKRIIELLRRRSIITKLVGTYLRAIPERIDDMCWHDNVVHGQYNQVVARTGRLSSSNPNMQNNSEDVDRFFVSRFND